MRLWKIFCKIVGVKKSKCDFRKNLDALCCTGAAHDHHLTHEKIDLSNQANMHTTTRSQLCGNCFRVSHWKIWSIFSEYYKQSSRSIVENNDSISNHNLIRIYQSLETARESYFEEKKYCADQNSEKLLILKNLIQTIIMKYNTMKLYFWIYFDGPQHADHVGWVARGNTIWTWHIPRVKHDLHGEDQPWRTIDSTILSKCFWKEILILMHLHFPKIYEKSQKLLNKINRVEIKEASYENI